MRTTTTSRTSRRNARPQPAYSVARTRPQLARDLPLRDHAERALSDFFANLNGHRPARLYDLVLREVEEPLFRTVLDYAAGNQSQAAIILGITRGTLRKKLREFGLSA
jgi:Fis family transcriptional regulator